MTDNLAETEDRRAKYRAIVDYELAMTQARFQTLAIFFAAVGFIVGLGHFSRSIGALLLFVTSGLWIIDVRSRDSLDKWRRAGQCLEEDMLAAGGLFSSRIDRTESVRFGFFAAKWPVEGWLAGWFVFQVGADVIFSSVFGFAIALLCGETGWWGC
ncbi:MAG TPA: hypothetical protein VHQ98_03175 [Gaiellaceae bacterium]|nr:hypothetical protein [Gaiellaceae bacterium]